MSASGMMVFTGNSNPELSEKIVEHLSLPLGKAIVGQFSDGEVMVEIQENVRGEDELGIYSALAYLVIAGTTVVMALAQATLARLGRHYADRRPDLMRRDIRRLLWIGSGMGAAIAAAAWSVAVVTPTLRAAPLAFHRMMADSAAAKTTAPPRPTASACEPTTRPPPAAAAGTAPREAMADGDVAIGDGADCGPVSTAAEELAAELAADRRHVEAEAGGDKAHDGVLFLGDLGDARAVAMLQHQLDGQVVTMRARLAVGHDQRGV